MSVLHSKENFLRNITVISGPGPFMLKGRVFKIESPIDNWGKIDAIVQECQLCLEHQGGFIYKEYKIETK